MAKKPFLKLRRRYEDEGLLQQEFAALADIPKDTMRLRINTPEEKSTWRPCEIMKICKAMHIPQEQIGEYFFPAVEKGASV